MAKSLKSQMKISHSFRPAVVRNQQNEIEKAKRGMKEDILLLFDGVLEAISLVSCGQFK